MTAPVVTDKPAHAPLIKDAERRSWIEFRQAGMFTVANTVLHWFGWQITLAVDTDTGEVVDVYPERTKWRGFQPELYANAMERLGDWLVRAAPSLREDIRDDEPPRCSGCGAVCACTVGINGSVWSAYCGGSDCQQQRQP